MNKKYYRGRACKNIKYGTMEVIEDTGKMKGPLGESGDKVIEPGQWSPDETYSANVTIRMNKKMQRFLDRHRAFHNGFERQMAVLRENPKHLAVIYRCSLYGDRIPHKYRVMYPEVIRAKNVLRCSRQMKRL